MSDRKTTKATLAAKNSRETRDTKKAAKKPDPGVRGRLAAQRDGSHDKLDN